MNILVPGVIGWTILIVLGLVAFVTLLSFKLRKKGKEDLHYIYSMVKSAYPFTTADTQYPGSSANQPQSHQASLPCDRRNAIIMNSNPAFSARESVGISNEHTHKNISYRAIGPDQQTNINNAAQMPGLVTRVNTGNRQDQTTLIHSNCAYEVSGESLYEDIV